MWTVGSSPQRGCEVVLQEVRGLSHRRLEDRRRVTGTRAKLTLLRMPHEFMLTFVLPCNQETLKQMHFLLVQNGLLNL